MRIMWRSRLIVMDTLVNLWFGAYPNTDGHFQMIRSAPLQNSINHDEKFFVKIRTKPLLVEYVLWNARA